MTLLYIFLDCEYNIRFGSSPTTWENAKADCESRGERMLTLKSAEKSNWLVNQIANAGTDASCMPAGKIAPFVLLIKGELDAVIGLNINSKL